MKKLHEVIDHPDQVSFGGVRIVKSNPKVLLLPCGHSKNLDIKVDDKLINSQDNVCPVKSKYPTRKDVNEFCR